MRRRLARSLKVKLMLVILLTTGVALLFAFTAQAFLQYYTTRNELLQVASSMAEVVAANSTAALTFDDSRAAQQTSVQASWPRAITHPPAPSSARTAAAGRRETPFRRHPVPTVTCSAAATSFSSDP